MKKFSPCFQSFLSAFGVLVYVAVVATVINNGNRLFGQSGNFWGPVVVLLLLVLSVAVVGLLIFGRPVYLYFENQKKEAWTLVLYTVGWLAAIVVVVLILLATVLKGSVLY